MFVAVGAVNIAVSTLVLSVLPESPASATSFLMAAQRARIAERLRSDAAGVGDKVFWWQSLLEALGDVQTWLLVVLAILITIPSGVITTFSAILIKNFGYISKQSALLNMPSGVVSIAATMLSTWVIARGNSRWVAINILLVLTLLGACLMSFLPRANQGGCLAGIYLVNIVCIYLGSWFLLLLILINIQTVALLALIFAWTGANFKGYTMKVLISITLN